MLLFFFFVQVINICMERNSHGKIDLQAYSGNNAVRSVEDGL